MNLNTTAICKSQPIIYTLVFWLIDGIDYAHQNVSPTIWNFQDYFELESGCFAGIFRQKISCLMFIFHQQYGVNKMRIKVKALLGYKPNY